MEIYYDEKSAKYLLALLAHNTTLLSRYPLTDKDFINYKIGIETYNDGSPIYDEYGNTISITIDYNKIFILIDRAYREENIQRIHSGDVAKELGTQYVEYLKQWSECAAEENIDSYYEKVRKHTILREASKVGVDCSELYSDTSKFNLMSIEDINNAIIEPSGRVAIEQSYGGSDERWIPGSNPEREVEDFFSQEPWGHKTMSPMLNTMIHGWKERYFYEIVASSGSGKSMMTYSNIGNDLETPTLYIGTEMDIENDCKPQVTCCHGYLNYNIIKNDRANISPEMKEQYLKAYKDIQHTYFERKPDYNLIYLNNIVNSYKQSYGVKIVYLDYMEATPSMTKEEEGERESLNLLAKFCKENIAKKDVAVIAMAQANGLLKDKKLSEITQENIKGSHTIHNKADCLMFMMEGGTRDIEYLNKANNIDFNSVYFNQYENLGIYKNEGAFGPALIVNPLRLRKILIYKNRPDPQMRGYCLWSFVENGTLRWHDLFVTDSEYKIINIEGKEL